MGFQQFEAVLGRHRNRLPWILGGTVVLFLLGFWLVFIRPGQVLAQAKAEALAKIEQADQSLEKAKRNVGSLGWFNETYTNGPERLVQDAEGRLNTGPDCARELLKRAESGSWKAKRDHYRGATKAATSALTSAQAADADATTALQLQREALTSQKSLSTGVTAAEGAINPLQGRIETDTKQYPRSYGRDANNRRTKLVERLQALANTLTSVAGFLPAEDIQKRGDPRQALAKLTPALAECGSAKKDIQALTEWLDLTNRQHLDADQKVFECEQRLDQVRKELTSKRSRTELWLLSAGALLSTSETNAAAARSLLTAISPGETVPDRPLAFRTADEAVTKCGQVITEAEREITFAKSVKKDAADLDREIGALSTLVSGYDALFRTLTDYHADSLWVSHKGIRRDYGSTQVGEARKQLREVNRLSGLDVQEFTRANELVQAQLAHVRRLKEKAAEFGQFVAQVEGYRTKFPTEKSRAKNEIDDQRSYISNYGSYDTSAKSSFESAEGSLRSADNYARDGFYAEAVRYTKLAASQASGTGAQAKAAYDRHQSSSSSNWGSGSSFDWGSDSGSSGSGSGSDSGWGGGSDSDYGGGSDSSWGGGSDSDW